MKRKTALFILIVLCTCIAAVSAASLELFELSHPVYYLVETLYVLEGKASPMGAKPWTQSDVKRLTEIITPSNEYSLEIKEKITSYIKEDDGFIFNAVIEPKLMVHTNSELKGRNYIVSADLLDRQFAVLGLGYRYRDNMALYMDLALSVSPVDVHNVNPDLSAGSDHGKRLSSTWGTNIP
ncbi:MAG: hypothetical protein ACI4NM_01800, partial [Bullifex sp.]